MDRNEAVYSWNSPESHDRVCKQPPEQTSLIHRGLTLSISVCTRGMWHVSSRGTSLLVPYLSSFTFFQDRNYVIRLLSCRSPKGKKLRVTCHSWFWTVRNCLLFWNIPYTILSKDCGNSYKRRKKFLFF